MTDFTDFYRKRARIPQHGTAVLDTYVVQECYHLHHWKTYQAENKNPHFAQCKYLVSKRSDFKQFFIVKRYETLTSIRDDADELQNTIIMDLLELYHNKWRGTVAYFNHQLDGIINRSKEDEQLYAALSAMRSVMRSTMCYDFRIDNVLWCKETGRYILWDVLNY